MSLTDLTSLLCGGVLCDQSSTLDSLAKSDSFEAYTVAWISALPHERAAGEAMFDVTQSRRQTSLKMRAIQTRIHEARFGSTMKSLPRCLQVNMGPMQLRPLCRGYAHRFYIYALACW